MLSSDAYASSNGFGVLKVEMKRLFGVSALLRQVVWVMPLTLGDDAPMFLHSLFLFEGPQLCLIFISSTMMFSIYFRYISVSELHVL